MITWWLISVITPEVRCGSRESEYLEQQQQVCPVAPTVMWLGPSLSELRWGWAPGQSTVHSRQDEIQCSVQEALVSTRETSFSPEEVLTLTLCYHKSETDCSDSSSWAMWWRARPWPRSLTRVSGATCVAQAILLSSHTPLDRSSTSQVRGLSTLRAVSSAIDSSLFNYWEQSLQLLRAVY